MLTIPDRTRQNLEILINQDVPPNICKGKVGNLINNLNKNQRYARCDQLNMFSVGQYRLSLDSFGLGVHKVLPAV